MLDLAPVDSPVASRGGTALIKSANLPSANVILYLRKFEMSIFCALNVVRLFLLNASPLIFHTSHIMCSRTVKHKEKKEKKNKKKNPEVKAACKHFFH